MEAEPELPLHTCILCTCKPIYHANACRVWQQFTAGKIYTKKAFLGHTHCMIHDVLWTANPAAYVNFYANKSSAKVLIKAVAMIHGLYLSL